MSSGGLRLTSCGISILLLNLRCSLRLLLLISELNRRQNSVSDTLLRQEGNLNWHLLFSFSRRCKTFVEPLAHTERTLAVGWKINPNFTPALATNLAIA